MEDLDAGWDELVLLRMVRTGTARNHWSDLITAVDGNLMRVDPVHHEEAGSLTSAFKRIPLEIFYHFGNALSPPVFVEDKPGRTTLDVFDASDALLGVRVPDRTTVF